MKATDCCHGCLQRLVYQAVNMATCDEQVRQKAIEAGLETLERKFSTSEVTVTIAIKVLSVMQGITHNPDPYRARKEQEMAIAEELYDEVKSQYESDFEGCLKLAAAANTMDFFKDPALVRDEMKKPVAFTIDDSQLLEARLREAKRILYLADNAGEIYFDLPFLRWMRRFAEVTYVVKPAPVQNDVTLEDIRKAGLESAFGRVITTGVACPGVLLALASDEFRQEFASAGLIFTKGMGYYETLSEYPGVGKVFYCLMAKCQPVANALRVPLNSYVAMLR